MSKHKAHGRRRVSTPAAPARGRRAQPGARHYGDSARRRARLDPVDFSGVGQRAAIVVATSGLAMSVIVPATAAVSPEEASTTAAAASAAPAVSAPASAAVSFERSDLRSGYDPEAKLHSIMLSSDGGLEPADADNTLDAPVGGENPTSGFGYRVNPLTGYAGELHTGQDFGIDCGAPVLAAAAGVVTEAGWHSYGGGYRVVVDHGDGLKTTYNHLSAIDVAAGQTVERAEKIAAAGTTGASTGCHLHFEVLVDGRTVDPLRWL